MTPTQKLKWAIVAKVASWNGGEPPPYPCPDIDVRFDALVENDEHWDGMAEVRCSGEDTGLACPFSQASCYYESKSVACRMPDGTWIGWTYWYGGGKHGNPDEMSWMEDAYELDCSEEEKIVVVRTFTVR